MKKNFLAIASLLIAAMLLMVSCNQEVAPVDNGLVEAKLTATAAGKALTITPDGDTVAYSVTLDAKWEPTTEMESIVGEGVINNVDITNAINLGYLSQGLWNVKVEGKIGTEVVIKGETTTYITADKKSVVVFLGTDVASSKETTIYFNIDVNDLAAADNGSPNKGYSLKAEIKSADNRNTVYTDTVSLTGAAKENSANITNYTGSTKLTPGYYKVTVKLAKGENSIIGGITRGLLVLGETQFDIAGSVSASDFTNGSLTVKTPKISVSVSATAEGSAVELRANEDLERSEGDVKAGATNLVSIVYTASASVVEGTTGDHISNAAFVYAWFVDGKEQSATGETFTLKDAGPGDKNVTCVATTVFEYNDNISKYSFTAGNEAVTRIRVNENNSPAKDPLPTQSANN